MRKRIILIIAILFLISFMIILIYGRTSTIEYNIGKYENISIDYNHNIIKCSDEINNGRLKINISPIKKGNI